MVAFCVTGLIWNTPCNAFTTSQTFKNRRLRIASTGKQALLPSRFSYTPGQRDPFFGQMQMANGEALSVGDNTSNLNDHRYSASDWLHNIYTIRRSTILRDIQGPVSTIFLWSVSVSVVHRLLKSFWPAAARFICIPSTPHSLLVSALGLLLVFRTNSAYQRFTEGRKIWEQIHSVSRNLSRFTCLYEEDIGTARKLRAFRLLGAFPYLLHDHILSEKSALVKSNGHVHTSVNDFWQRGKTKTASPVPYEIYQGVPDEESVPWCLFPPKARKKCFESENPPIWVCDRLSQEFTKVAYGPNFTARERFTFLSHIDKLSKSVGECERIHQTAVPQNYARHSLRSLSFWLVTLPFALVQELGLLTGPVMGVTAWLLFGVYQIGASIEDPFQGSLRLRMLCDAIYRDLMYGSDMKNPRETAYQLDQTEATQWKELGELFPFEPSATEPTVLKGRSGDEKKP
jgi:predicted membrane chloride channel (bestrophin family)